jgi:hypothetical protein
MLPGEHSLQTARKLSDRSWDLKEVIKSLQSTWAPYMENTYEEFWYKTEKNVDVRERLLLVRRILVYNEQTARVAENEFHRLDGGVLFMCIKSSVLKCATIY